MYRQLENLRVSPEFETTPTAAYACPPASYDLGQQDADAQPSPCQTNQLMPDAVSPAPDATPVKIPKLLKTYLAIGARIAAPPAWDREFHTIDFLTLLDLESLAPAARERFLGTLTSE